LTDIFDTRRKEIAYDKLADCVGDLTESGISTAEIVYFMECVKHALIAEEFAEESE